MPVYPRSTAEPQWKPYAARALHSAMAGDMQGAADALMDQQRACGADSITDTVLALIDTMLHNTGVEEYGGAVQPAWRSIETGQVAGPDGTPAPVVWAGRLVAARMADDPDTYMALVAAVPKGEQGRYVMAVVNVVATTLRGGAR